MCNLSYAISEEAEKKGIEKGIKQSNAIIYKKVEDGALSPENGAIAMDITVEEFIKEMSAEGYKIPTLA